jgi:excisionase family DNA binding protein
MLADRPRSQPDQPIRLVAGTRRPLTRNGVMTASEVAELLRMPLSTVYELARRGELPSCRFGRTWRFLRSRIEEQLDR